MDSGDPHDQIVRLETYIEELEATLASCRKFILAARIALALSGILFIAILFGAIRYDLTVTALTAAMAALLGGIVVYGSNSSTAKEAANALAAAEANRAALIGQIELRVVEGNETLH